MSDNLLSKLPRMQRQAYVARRLCELPLTEIARLLRCAPPQVERLVRSAEASLREFTDDENSSMSDPVSLAAAQLAAECPIRVCAQLHLSGDYQHYRLADGRVRCYAKPSEPPEDASPSEAQRTLWKELSRGEADE